MNFCKCYQKSHLHTSAALYKITAQNLKRKSKSSQAWLQRQLCDQYVKKAKLHNFRCRSAFKLLEMNAKQDFLYPGMFVIDVGAAPGSWSQVAATMTNSNNKNDQVNQGKVVGIDLRGISPIDGVELLYPYDFTSPEAQKKLKEVIGEQKVDVVLSDMAPNCTGMKEMDHDNLIELGYSVLRFALLNTKPGGTCLIKLWVGRNSKKFEVDAGKYYGSVKYLKPDASRGDSSEIYLFARDFKGLEQP